MTPKHFMWRLDGGVGTVTLNRPERKNPLTFDSYAELRDSFRALDGDDVDAIVQVGTNLSAVRLAAAAEHARTGF